MRYSHVNNYNKVFFFCDKTIATQRNKNLNENKETEEVENTNETNNER